jgi:hypothetical protein
MQKTPNSLKSQNQLSFNEKLNAVFPQLKNRLIAYEKNNKLSNKPNDNQQDQIYVYKENSLNNVINNQILEDTNYNLYEFKERLAVFDKHYQKKFQDTKKIEYNIKIHNLEDDTLSDTDKKDLKQFILDNTPSENQPPKATILTRYSHATSVLITHDDKILIIDLSTSDAEVKKDIQDVLDIEKMNKTIILCENYNMSKEESPQKGSNGCIVFAFKYLKLLCTNNYALFDGLKPEPEKENVFILPPDLLKYAQSETVVTKVMSHYNNLFKLSDNKSK